MRPLIIILTTILITAGGQLSAQDNDITKEHKVKSVVGEDFICSKIPDSLLKEANAVLRSSTTSINIKSLLEVEVTRKYAITVLNKDGDDYAKLAVSYSPLNSIISIKGWQFDKDGKEIARLKKNSTIKDYGYTSVSFFDDLRFKSFKFEHTSYPYTCVFEVVEKYNHCFTIPSWDPQEAHDFSVQKAEITVTYPADMKLNYRTFHTSIPAVLKTENEQNILTMSISGLKTYPKQDDFTVPEDFNTPALAIMADKVELESIQGSLSTWKDFGKFFYELNAKRDDLPGNVRKTIHQLTDTCTTPSAKIKLLYEYLQKNTRYVNISLGIGGWQTHEATFVAEKGYGDCKALSNYMKSLLKEVNITAYQALVYGGSRLNKKMINDFPYHAFNHVILCVPNNQDTIWLECTSNNLPTGYLSSFTSNRNVLLLTPDGGFMVKTPAYKANKSMLNRSAIITINDKDEWQGSVNAQYSGYLWDMEANKLEQDKDKIVNYMNSKFSIPTYKVGEYNITKSLVNKIPVINEQIPLNGTGNISRNGSRMFLVPQVLQFSIEKAKDNETRTDSFEIVHDYQINDTTIINLTGNYISEKLCSEINIDQPFGSYHSKATFENDHTLKIVVSYHQIEGYYPAKMFVDYVKMSKRINANAAYSTVVLNKKS